MSFNVEHIKVIAYNHLCAVNFLHKSKIMHRDLKPANVLIDEHCCVRLCDFGISRTEIQPTLSSPMPSGDSTRESRSLQRDSKVEPPKRNLSRNISTRWYRSPEVILVQPDYNSKADMWSVGCILAELLFLLQPKNIESYSNRNVLFPGGSCFPISPKQDCDYDVHH